MVVVVEEAAHHHCGGHRGGQAAIVVAAGGGRRAAGAPADRVPRPGMQGAARQHRCRPTPPRPAGARLRACAGKGRRPAPAARRGDGVQRCGLQRGQQRQLRWRPLTLRPGCSSSPKPRCQCRGTAEEPEGGGGGSPPGGNGGRRTDSGGPEQGPDREKDGRGGLSWLFGNGIAQVFSAAALAVVVAGLAASSVVKQSQSSSPAPAGQPEVPKWQQLVR